MQPAASAGASFQAAISSGKFQGMICAGDADRLAQREVEPGAETGIVSPQSLVAAPA